MKPTDLSVGFSFDNNKELGYFIPKVLISISGKDGKLLDGLSR